MNIKNILAWFQKAVPTPTDANRAVQIGCHFEEVAEMAEATGDSTVGMAISDLATYYKSGHTGVKLEDVDQLELLDACCDQIVTAIGIAHMFGFDISGALAAVDKNNWDKFVNGEPIFNENGKIIKRDGHLKVDLMPYLPLC